MIRKIVFILVFLILAGGAGYYIYHNKTDVKRLVSGGAGDIKVGVEGTGDFKVKEIKGGKSDTCSVNKDKGTFECDGARDAFSLPDLSRKIIITADLPEKVKEITRKKIEKLSAELKKNHDLFNSWLQLGIYRKIIGDYEGAAELWEYAGKIRPKNSTSFNNLGDLYAYYLKDNKKAEDNFLTALKNGPDQIYIYRNAYDFYRNVLKNDAKAKEILQKGIKLNPKTSQDLQYLLNHYK